MTFSISHHLNKEGEWIAVLWGDIHCLRGHLVFPTYAKLQEPHVNSYDSILFLHAAFPAASLMAALPLAPLPIFPHLVF